MSVLYVVLPIALVLASAFVAAFLWAVRGGQFDDLQTPGVRMLTDDDTPRPKRGEVESDKPAPRG